MSLLGEYWFPLGHVSEFPIGVISRRTLHGEPLVIARAEGKWLAAREACAHRGASLADGFVSGSSFVCPYHGMRTRCSSAREAGEPNGFISTVSVRVAGELVFVTLAARPPDFPYFSVLEQVDRAERGYRARFAHVRCNWQLAAENTLDPSHLEFLHSRGRAARGVLSDRETRARHQSGLSFEETDLGIVKRRRLVGQGTDSEDWAIGQSYYFPSVFSISSPGFIELHFRSPLSLTETLYVWYRVEEDSDPQTRSWSECPLRRDKDGRVHPDDLDSEDIMVLESQERLRGTMSEHLTQADAGVRLLRDMLDREATRLKQQEPVKGLSYSGDDVRIEVPVRRNTQKVVDDLRLLSLQGGRV